MDNRQGEPGPLASRRLRLAVALDFLLGVSVCAHLLSGCASPGEPIERRPPAPEAATDLAAHQAGNSIALSFTLPKQTVDRRPLNPKQPVEVEIYRDFEPIAITGSPSTATAPATLLATIPPAMISRYTAQGRFAYADELRPDDFLEHPNSTAVYAVRTRASAKAESPVSNVVSLRIDPLPDPIDDLKAGVTHAGIALSWTAPTRTPVGPAPSVVAYRIYRSGAQAAAESVAAPLASALLQIAEATSTAYTDTQIQFGNSYIYTVRSVVEIAGQKQESADSNLVTVAARGTIPPAPPEGLVGLVVPAEGGQPAYVELSWSISVETDVAGYNVYRSEQAGVQGIRLNRDLLPTPAFRDMNAVPGRTYFFRVTAVDRSGNESLSSGVVSETLPVEGQPVP